MIVFALTDIHGRTTYPEEVRRQLSNADIVVIAGDITNFGGARQATEIIDAITTLNDRVLAISGNCDQNGVDEILSAGKMNIHGTTRTIGDIQFLGIGGSNKTPFHTPHEYSEKQIKQTLDCFPKSTEARFRILISHAPPFKSKVDKMFFGMHVGSKAIRQYAETSQPDILLCGHIHEARGFDRIGKTLIINPGPFPKHYAIINIDDTLEYQLY